MRQCRACQRTYGDDVQFCFDDGEPLVSQSVAMTKVEFAATIGKGPAPTAGLSAAMPRLANDTGIDPSTDVEGLPRFDPLSPGAQVGEYIVEKQIGEGGMGQVFSASHPIIGKKVAIKVLTPQMAASPEMVGRFVQEAKSVNKIRHRNIVDIFSFGQLADGRHYFAMEFLEGMPLSQRTKQGPMPPDEAMPVWLQVAGAIEAAHEHNVVHRDLKPDNVFLCHGADGAFVKVLDFGIAKLLGDAPAGLSKTSTGMPIGTPTYMSPEQAVGTAVDHRADLYAYGIILFECMTGRPPFEGKTVIDLLNKHMNEPAPQLSTLVPADPALEALIAQLLAKAPEERPASMTAVRQELVRLRDEAQAEGRTLYGPPQAAPRKPTRTTPRRAGQPSGNRALVAALGVGAIGVAAVAAVALRGKPSQPVATPPVVIAAPPVETAPRPPAPTAGRVVISTNAPSMKVYLDKPDGPPSSEPVAAGGGFVKVAVPSGSNWKLRVEAPGYQPFTTPVRLEPGDETSMPVVLVPVGEPHKTSHAATRPAPQTPSVAKPATEKPRPTNPNMIDPF